LRTPEGLFAELLADRPTQPFVTYYDGATGERVELFARSLGNWVAKTHSADGRARSRCGRRGFRRRPRALDLDADPARLLDRGPGDRYRAGSCRRRSRVPGWRAASAGVLDVYAVSPESPATGVADGPLKGARDYVRPIRPQPEAWSSVRPLAGEDDQALDGKSRATLVAVARARAAHSRSSRTRASSARVRGRVPTTGSTSTPLDPPSRPIPRRCHVSHVVVDSGWELAIADALESMAGGAAYLKNDHLEFIPYTYEGRAARDRPDFLARLDGPDYLTRTLIIEVSGGKKQHHSPGPVSEKAATTRNLLLPAVNRNGSRGQWGYVEVGNPLSVHRSSNRRSPTWPRRCRHDGPRRHRAGPSREPGGPRRRATRDAARQAAPAPVVVAIKDALKCVS
jgi:hypothetical protein